MQRFQQLEQEQNSLDLDSRRCNLKFLRVREPTRDNYRANYRDNYRDNHRASANVIVDALNECSSSRTWEPGNTPIYREPTGSVPADSAVTSHGL